MPSPDLSSFVDLRIYDKDPQEVFEAALQLLQVSLPEWTPQEGNTEVLLLEALAYQVAESIFAINRLPGAMIEILLRLYGIERSEGLPPTATVTITLADGLGHDIPAGTRLKLDLTDGLEPVVFTTDIALSIGVGESTGVVAITGTTNTVNANGTPIATRLDLLDSIAFINRVELATAVSGGADQEADLDWYTRGVNRFDRLSETLVVPDHFVSAALEHAEVSRAFALDMYDPAADVDNNGPVGDDPGHMTVAVYGDGDVVSAPVKTDLEAEFESTSIAMLDIHIIDPTITSVAVTVTVEKLAAYLDSEVEANITARLQEYLNPATWEWAQTVYRNELISVIDQVEGVGRVVTLAAPASDQALTGVAPLAEAGAITVTVS